MSMIVCIVEEERLRDKERKPLLETTVTLLTVSGTDLYFRQYFSIFWLMNGPHLLFYKATAIEQTTTFLQEEECLSLYLALWFKVQAV